MAQYIDKDALVAEIDERIKKYILLQQVPEMSDLQEELQYKIDCLNSIKGYIINTLEVKEVDLEKEIKESIINEWCDEWSGDVGNWIRCRKGTTSMTVEDVKDIAKHFFELGLKAQKGD